jgi:hypothetical protein
VFLARFVRYGSHGNGRSDIVWRDAGTGSTAIWFMQGLTIHATAGLGTVPTTWTVQGHGD